MAATRQTDRVVLREFAREALDALKTREDGLAFWINTYNALVVEGILALEIRETVPVNGALRGETDWAAIGVEITPLGGSP